MKDGLLLAFSTYTVLPLPYLRQERLERAMKNTLPMLCFVGLFIGCLQSGLLLLLLRFPFSAEMIAVCMLLLPILLSGGIHLDGFMDVSDGKNAHGDKEKTLQIMKDPHIGAFAVIRLAVLLLAEFAFYDAVVIFAGAGDDAVRFLVCGTLVGIPVLTRCAGAYLITSLPRAKKDGMAVLMSQEKKGSRIILTEMIITGCALCGWSAAWGILYGEDLLHKVILAGTGPMLCLTLLFCVWHIKASFCKKIGGITGDVAGYFIEGAGANLLLVLMLCCLFFFYL